MVYFLWAEPPYPRTRPPIKVRFGLRPKRTVNMEVKAIPQIDQASPTENAEDKYLWNFSKGMASLSKGKADLKI